jgi:hypothetical protein
MDVKKIKTKRACFVIVLIVVILMMAAFSYLAYGLVMAWYTL